VRQNLASSLDLCYGKTRNITSATWPIALAIQAASLPKERATAGRTPREEKERRAAMIAYVTIGTTNMERATQFYTALLAELDPGIKVLMDAGRIKLWGKPGAPSLAVATPFDGKPATVGNGVMVALAADSPAKVDAVYKKALALGGTDEGAPGRRGGEKGPYIGYFRDLDGNKLNAICMG
jgi:catechol 2,3-dioxygenase-like lactoylglutathione lyase family enzyme